MGDESRKLLWPDEDDWLDLFREYLCGHPELAERVARIYFALLEHLAHGPEDLREARTILKQAFSLTYPFTGSYRLAGTALEVLRDPGYTNTCIRQKTDGPKDHC
ncbi:MAG TPA: hypothetical protein VJX67_19280 [Blastocatellia bacterium]|nr:hypothetical protein [Blastocatellia bacterium]